MHEYGIAKNLSTVGYTLDGYVFMGWNTKEDGTGNPYSDGETVTNLASVDGTTVTLYAQWSKLHELTGTAFPVAGGTVSPATDTGASGTEINISALESGGYKFKEWKLTDDGVGSVVLEAAGYTLALYNEEKGCSATVDSKEIPMREDDFDFSTEGHFIDAEFLASALKGEAVWDQEENTLMLRIRDRDAVESAD